MNKKKQKTHRKHHAQSSHRGKKKVSSTSSNWDSSVRAELGVGTEPASEELSADLARGGYTPGEIGQIAPLDQEGEGNRQNAEAQELEEIEPDDLKPH